MSETEQPERGRGIPLSEEEWASIRADYELGHTITELSRVYNVKRESIYTRMSKDREKDNEWTRNGGLLEQARSNVVEIQTKKTIEALGGEEGIEYSATLIANTFRKQAETFTSMQETITKQLSKLNLGTLRLGRMQGETTATNELITANARLQAQMREYVGLTAGKPSSDAWKAQDDDEARIDQAVLVVKRIQPEEQQTA